METMAECKPPEGATMEGTPWSNHGRVETT